jgi:hypothetical protein
VKSFHAGGTVSNGLPSNKPCTTSSNLSLHLCALATFVVSYKCTPRRNPGSGGASFVRVSDVEVVNEEDCDRRSSPPSSPGDDELCDVDASGGDERGENTISQPSVTSLSLRCRGQRRLGARTTRGRGVKRDVARRDELKSADATLPMRASCAFRNQMSVIDS